MFSSAFLQSDPLSFWDGQKLQSYFLSSANNVKPSISVNCYIWRNYWTLCRQTNQLGEHFSYKSSNHVTQHRNNMKQFITWSDLLFFLHQFKNKLKSTKINGFKSILMCEKEKNNQLFKIDFAQLKANVWLLNRVIHEINSEVMQSDMRLVRAAGMQCPRPLWVTWCPVLTKKGMHH